MSLRERIAKQKAEGPVPQEADALKNRVEELLRTPAKDIPQLAYSYARDYLIRHDSEPSTGTFRQALAIYCQVEEGLAPAKHEAKATEKEKEIIQEIKQHLQGKRP